MSDAGTDPEQLVQGIEKEARDEADELMADAEKAAAERRTAVEQQAARILQEAKQRAAEKIERTERAAESALSVESRRISLRVREQVVLEMIDGVGRRISEMIDRGEYRDVLLGWIVEAAIGLNVGEAVVSVSARERSLVDDGLLRKAENEVKRLTDRSTSLTLSEEVPPLEQGVILTAKDGRIAYNNQLRTRFRRYDSEFRRIVYRELEEIE